MKKVLVTSGNIGSVVAKNLVQQGHQVSLMVRKSDENLELVKLGINLVVVDAKKPETLDQAFEGIETFFFVSPLIENMVELAENLVNASKIAGVTHIVRSSARGASVEAPITMGKLHGQVEELIKNSGIDYTIIQPASFFQNIFGSIGTIKAQKVFYGSSGNGKNSYVDVRDIAIVASTVISEGLIHFGNTYEITGSELLSNFDMAKIISEKLNSEINYIDLTPSDLGNAYKSYGMSDWITNAYLELDNITKLGYLATLTNDVNKITGKNPIKFSEFMNDNLLVFQ